VDQDLYAVCEALQSCESLGALVSAFMLLLSPLGMTAAASGMLTGRRGLSANPIHFRNWDPAWLALYEERGFQAFDPLIRYPMVSGEANSWSDIYARFPARDSGHAILKAASAFKYREGFVTPVRTAEGSLGLVSVGGNRRPPFSLAERLFLETTSAVVLRRAEALSGAAEPIEMPVPLSMRERECVGLLRAGLTDAEIAKVMSLSAATVRGHVDQARQKLGAKNRTQLAVMIVP
jgi:DNA-binding CsgD family transcriptional regulator